MRDVGQGQPSAQVGLVGGSFKDQGMAHLVESASLENELHMHPRINL